MPHEGSSQPALPAFVLDSYALLAFLGDEPGADAVGKLLETAKRGDCTLFICVINLGEVLYIAERERGLNEAHKVLAFLEDMPLTMVDVNRQLALAAAHIKAHSPIAYADCYAAALAQMMDAELVTGDEEFHKVKPRGLIRIRWIANQRGEKER